MMSHTSNENINNKAIVRTKKEFIRAISHNFNTKLTSIYSAVAIAIEFCKDYMRNHDKDTLLEIITCLEIIEEGSTVMKKIVDKFISDNS